MIKTARLAGPLIISRLGDMTYSFLFLSFVGHFLPKSLGQASFVWAFISFTTVVGIGLFSTLMIDAASLKGASRGQVNILLATGLRAAVTVGFLISGGVLACLLLQHGVVGLLQSQNFGLWIMSLSLPAIYCQIVIFNYLNATGRCNYEVKFVWLSNMVCVVVGIVYISADFPLSFIDFALVYMLLRWVLIFVLLTYIAHTETHMSLGSFFGCFLQAKITRFIIGGLPLALCFAGESFLYFALSLITATIGNLELSAYQISLHFLSVIYMISIGVGNAVAILVAGAAPDIQISAAKKRVSDGVKFGGLLMVPCLIICIALPDYVARLYTSDALVVKLASEVIRFSVLFLVFEFVYVVLRMALRSLGDSWVPTLATICCLNGVGLFLTWILLHFYDESLRSVFIGLTMCTSILMLYLSHRFMKICRKDANALLTPIRRPGK